MFRTSAISCAGDGAVSLERLSIGLCGYPTANFFEDASLLNNSSSDRVHVTSRLTLHSPFANCSDFQIAENQILDDQSDQNN